MEVFDLNQERQKRRPEYINSQRIIAAINDLEAEVQAITIASMDKFGAVDPIAFEIIAYTNAIRRSIAPAATDGEA